MNAKPRRDDGIHIPWAFALDDAPALPLVGERHPLRREMARWLATAGGVTLLVVVILLAAWLWWTHRAPPAAPVARS